MRKALIALVAAGFAGTALAQQAGFDSDTFGGLYARAIGPAAMSGRISALDAVAGERLTVWVGSASGGVWKSVDGGVQYKPVFDKHSQSIGALRVDARDPKTVWVGTGESWVRNSVSVGDGVYKTSDGGETWQRVGLESTERIAKIALDPVQRDTVFVCATGHAFDSHPERGVYRTRDAGKSWEKVLFVDADTGCADLEIDPKDGRTLYAAMWQFRRLPYFFTSGGPGSGLFKSSDGGSTWRRLGKGLPAGPLGRIALAVSPADPKVVYASVESQQDEKVKGSRDTALYRSDDAGESWNEQNASGAVRGRPFYFSRLLADPKDVKRVYKMDFTARISEDGGRTWSGLGAGGGLFGTSYHGDTHDMWINPTRTDELVMGTDGGVYLSHDRGFHWRFVGGLPVSQFYHVSFDMEWPYNVYGGLQDNSTWWGPSRRTGGVANKHWNALTPGDGFWAFPDPHDPDTVYNEYQGGNLFRISKSTLEAKDIKPSPRAGEPRYRFNWNTPIHLSPNDEGTLYYGAQFLFRSRDRGDSWERISPDLTTDDPNKQRQKDSGGLTLDNSTAENHCTIFSIAESPKDRNVIWIGTDDGNLQLTRDAGKTWSNVAANVPGLPKHTWVSRVDASPFDAATAFASFDGHMTGDMKPYVYKTGDFGKTWTSLASADMKGYAHVVRQDPVNPELLFVGTEMGLWLSLDGGKAWAQFTSNLPNVAVRDVAIHPRDHDLILATHGRGIYVVDDITPLRKLSREALAAEVAFLPTRAWEMPIFAFDFGSIFIGHGEFVGTVPEEAAYVTYYLKKRHIVGDLKLEVYDAKGDRVATLPGGKRKGINRVPWPMRLPPPRMPPGEQPSLGGLFGPRVLPGTYTVKMIKGKESYTSQVALTPDPRVKHTSQDRAAQHAMSMKLYGMLERLTMVVDSITDARDQARQRAAALPEKDALRKRLTAFEKSMEEQRKALVSTTRSEISGEEKLREQLADLFGAVNLYEGKPTESQLTRMGLLGQEMEDAYKKFQDTARKDLEAINRGLGAKAQEPVVPLTEEAWRSRQKG
jgi:photosystem II stability/assembly factor-like uncharacterized protein